MKSEHGHHLNPDAGTFTPSMPTESLSADADTFPSLIPSPPAPDYTPKPGAPTTYTSALILSLQNTASFSHIEIPSFYQRLSHKKNRRHRKKPRQRRNSDPGTPLLQVDAPEFAPKGVLLKQLRGILNKLSAENFSKCMNTVRDLVFTRGVLLEFASLIIKKRQESHSHLEVYARFVSELGVFLPSELKRAFLTQIGSLCLEQIRDGGVRITGMLFKWKAIEPDIVFNCLESLLEHKDVEEFYQLFKEHANILAFYNGERAKSCYEKIEELVNDPELSKRLKFRLMDLAEKKNQLLDPVDPNTTALPDVPKQASRVKFQFDAPEKTGDKKRRASILKKTLSNDQKAEVHRIVRGFQAEENLQAALEEIDRNIFWRNSKPELFVFEVFKFALIDFDQVEFLTGLCQLLVGICQTDVDKGMILVLERLEDIKLDSPHAANSFREIVRTIREKEWITSEARILEHINLQSMVK